VVHRTNWNAQLGWFDIFTIRFGVIFIVIIAEPSVFYCAEVWWGGSLFFFYLLAWPADGKEWACLSRRTGELRPTAALLQKTLSHW
jgi:hypothetical protein